MLECGNCNHYIGTAYDSHIALEKKDAMWNSGTIGSKKLIRLESGGRDAAVWSIWENGQTLAFKPTDMEDPNYKHLLDRFTDKRQQNTEINLNMSFQDKLIPEKRDVSLIHTAFLMMFYCFGYEYILSKEADIVRNILRSKKCPWEIGKMITTMSLPPGFTLPSAGVIKQPRRIRTFFVVLPSPIDSSSARLVFLPGFGKTGEKSFQHLLALRTPAEAKININIDSVNVDAVVDGPFWNGFCRMLWQGTAPKWRHHRPNSAQANQTPLSNLKILTD